MAIALRPYEPEHALSWRRVKTIVFLLIGLATIGWLLVDQRRAGHLRSLTSTGTRVRARVKEINSYRGGNILMLCYEFSLGSTAYEIRDRKVADFEGLQPRGPIDVWVDPDDPQTCVTRNELRHARFGATPLLFAGLIVLVMAAAALQSRQAAQPARDPDAAD